MTTPKNRFKQQWRILRLLLKVDEWGEHIRTEARKLDVDDKAISQFLKNLDTPDTPFMICKDSSKLRFYKDRIYWMQQRKRIRPTRFSLSKKAFDDALLVFQASIKKMSKTPLFNPFAPLACSNEHPLVSHREDIAKDAISNQYARLSKPAGEEQIYQLPLDRYEYPGRTHD